MPVRAARSSEKRWDDQERAEIAAQVIEGTLSIREACARHGLSPECIRDWVVRFRRSSLQALDEQLRRTLARQGLDASGFAGAELTGTLVDISIVDLIQTMGIARKDGVITISHAGSESRIWCVSGEIVDAESGKLHGEAAVHRILALQQGVVVAEFCPVTRDPAVRSSTSGLLLEGARRLDECSVLRQRLGAGAYTMDSSALSVSAAFCRGELDMLRLFESPRCIADALSESELGDLETLSIISKLMHDGYLVPSEEWRRTSQPTASESASPTGPSLIDFLPSAARLRARRRRRAAQLLGAGALCAGAWVCIHAALAPLNAPVPGSKVQPLSAPFAARSGGSTARANVAPVSFPSGAQNAEQLVPATASPSVFVPFPEKLRTTDDGRTGFAAGSPAAAAAATSPVPAPAVHRAARPRSAPRPAKEADAVQSSSRSSLPEASSVQPRVPRMQMIEDQTPRMQTLE